MRRRAAAAFCAGIPWADRIGAVFRCAKIGTAGDLRACGRRGAGERQARRPRRAPNKLYGPNMARPCAVRRKRGMPRANAGEGGAPARADPPPAGHTAAAAAARHAPKGFHGSIPVTRNGAAARPGPRRPQGCARAAGARARRRGGRGDPRRALLRVHVVEAARRQHGQLRHRPQPAVRSRQCPVRKAGQLDGPRPAQGVQARRRRSRGQGDPAHDAQGRRKVPQDQGRRL